VEVEVPEREETGGPSRKWPWIVGVVAGAIAGALTLAALSFAVFFDTGGTFGGFGAAADANVDWDRFDTMFANRVWIAVVVAFAVPVAWAVTRLVQAEDRAGRRQAGSLLVVLVAGAVLLAGVPPLRAWQARSDAIEPNSEVIAALKDASPGPVERVVDKPTEDGDWEASYRAGGYVDAEWTVEGGTWWCETSPYDDIRWFESDDGDWTEVRISNDGTTVSPADDGPTWPDVVECAAP
jgi:hypothetical protein